MGDQWLPCFTINQHFLLIFVCIYLALISQLHCMILTLHGNKILFFRWQFLCFAFYVFINIALFYFIFAHFKQIYTFLTFFFVCVFFFHYYSLNNLYFILRASKPKCKTILRLQYIIVENHWRLYFDIY